MNKRPFIILSAFLLLFSLIEKGQATETYRPETSVAGFIQLPGSGRQVYNFNPGWRFFRGDVRGAEAVNFDDRSWNVVSTPHTVELMPPKEADAAIIRDRPGTVNTLSSPLKQKGNGWCFILKQLWANRFFI